MNTNKPGDFKKDEKFTQRVGDKIERAGDKLSDKGMPRAGNAVRNLGDKIEHSQDSKK